MATVSVSVPKELKERMDNAEQINWSAIARNAFEHRLQKEHALNEIEKIAAKSKLTEQDAKMIAKKINHNVAMRFQKLSSTRTS